MTKVQENQNASGMYTKFWRIALVIVSVLLIFAGPTYLPYLMSKAHVGDVASASVGVVLFAIGIAMVWFLANKKIIE